MLNTLYLLVRVYFLRFFVMIYLYTVSREVASPMPDSFSQKKTVDIVVGPTRQPFFSHSQCITRRAILAS